MDYDEDLKEKSPELIVSDVSDETLSKTRHPSEETLPDPQQPGSQPAERPDDLIGKTIGGHYEILSKLGAGGMSTVYKAKHLLLDRLVAIKFILPKLIFDEQAALRFQQEAKASTQLNHENICNVREFEIHEGNRAFLVMDYLDGCSLTDILRVERTLDQQRALAIMSGICRGLAHAHSKGVIHRDIKPANVVIHDNDFGQETVKIVDFGLAKMLREDQAGPNLTQTGEVFGTPYYMSPEQCLGRRVDARSDIYSLGCVLHELIYGTPPFRGESTVEVMLAHVNEIPELRGTKDIEKVILKCLEKNADKRYATVDELLEDIEALREKRTPAHAKPSGGSVRNKIGIALIIVCLTIAGTVGGITYNTMMKNKEIRQQWNVENTRSREMVQQKRFAEAEQSLEHQLALAQETKNHELITLSLSNLSNVEQSMGKGEEAQEHARAAAARPATGVLNQFFIGIAVALIFIGLLIAILAMLLFGPSRRNKKFWNSTLSDIWTKTNR